MSRPLRIKRLDAAILRHPETRGLTGGPLAIGKPAVNARNSYVHMSYRDRKLSVWHTVGNGTWALHQLTGTGGLTSGAPAAGDPVSLLCKDLPDEVDVYFRDASAKIWRFSHRADDSIEQITGPDSAAGGPAAAGDPVVAEFNGGVYVFYRDQHGGIWYAVRTTGWSIKHLLGPDSSVGGPPTVGEPAVTIHRDSVYGEQQFHLCYRDTDGKIWHFFGSPDAGPSTLEHLPGLPAAGDPALIMYSYHESGSAPDRAVLDVLHVFYRDHAGTISHLTYIPRAGSHPDGWDYELVTGPRGKLGGDPAAADPVVIRHLNALIMFYQDTAGRIWSADFGGTAWTFNRPLTGPGSELGGPSSASAPRAVMLGDGKYWNLFYRDDGGIIWLAAQRERSRRLYQVTGPRSVRYLQQRFGPRPHESLRQLLIRMGPFDPISDGFRFSNSFHLTREYAEQIKHIFTDWIDSVARGGGKPFKDIMGDWRHEVPGLDEVLTIPDTVIGFVVEKVVGFIGDRLTDLFALSPISKTVGRCGGLAFAGYDFYQLDWPVDERLGTSPPDSGTLGDYITVRLFDSLRANGGKFVECLMALYVYPAISKVATQILLAALTGPVAGIIQLVVKDDADFFHLGGLGDLLSRTRADWEPLKAKLDGEAAWPIGVVFAGEAKYVLPWEHHQVLAIGYTDNGDGTAILKVWDNNDHDSKNPAVGAEASDLLLDFNGDELTVGNFNKGAMVKAFFVEDYTPARPPDTLNFSEK